MGKRIGHTDYRELAWDQNTTPLKKTPEGFLQGRVCLTGAGVFTYLNEDGSILRVLRSVDEVQKSIAGLNLKPVTSLHPTQDVTATNARDLQVGAIANDVVFDGLNAFATISINDADAVRMVDGGELQALSCGYDCERVMESGTWQGSDYDAIQKNIVYNHVALVKEGRAGDSVRLRIGDSVQVSNNKTKEAPVALKKTTLDGVEREAEAEVIVALTKANDSLKDLETKLTASDTRASKAEAERDAAREEAKKAKLDDSAIQKAVDERVALLDLARTHSIEIKDTKDVAAIKKAVIAKAIPSMNLDGKDATYIDTAFDIAKNALSSSQNGANRNVMQDDKGAVTTLDSIEAARKAQDEAIYNPNKAGK